MQSPKGPLNKILSHNQASYKSSYACTAELLAPVNGKLSRPRFFTRLTWRAGNLGLWGFRSVRLLEGVLGCWGVTV